MGSARSLLTLLTIAAPRLAAADTVTVPAEAHGKSASLQCKTGYIRVREASYGADQGGPKGNATTALQAACDGRAGTCTYAVDFGVLGDPAPGKVKAFTATYDCTPAAVRRSATDGWLPAEASGTTTTLSCAGTLSLRVIQASYGIGASTAATSGNATSTMATACNGRSRCTFAVDVGQLGDPAPGKPKDFQYTYACEAPSTPSGATESKLAAEASGKTLALACATGAIAVADATYGQDQGAQWGNATAAVQAACNGKPSCAYVVDHAVLGDPAPGKAKGFIAHHTCTDPKLLAFTRCRDDFKAAYDRYLALHAQITRAPRTTAGVMSEIEQWKAMVDNEWRMIQADKTQSASECQKSLADVNDFVKRATMLYDSVK